MKQLKTNVEVTLEQFTILMHLIKREQEHLWYGGKKDEEGQIVKEEEVEV